MLAQNGETAIVPVTVPEGCEISMADVYAGVAGTESA